MRRLVLLRRVVWRVFHSVFPSKEEKDYEKRKRERK